ncbi:MAG TPA: peroxiredoxin [Burkholderiaceae bacterium]|jgi:peroxiredoxin Q/BCP|nr:peroxiredoxin [Burkholderiaceae bacterium]
MAVTVDKSLPDFAAPATGGEFRLADQRGRTVVLYFYPKDNTPGCTTEGLEFAAAEPKFRKANAMIVGASRDSVRSHEGFKTKMGFPFELISDTDEALCSLFEVIKMKNMYGKQVRGIERSTFVIDAEGKLRKAWRGVKVPGHVDDVLSFVQSL